MKDGIGGTCSMGHMKFLVTFILKNETRIYGSAEVRLHSVKCWVNRKEGELRHYHES